MPYQRFLPYTPRRPELFFGPLLGRRDYGFMQAQQSNKCWWAMTLFPVHGWYVGRFGSNLPNSALFDAHFNSPPRFVPKASTLRRVTPVGPAEVPPPTLSAPTLPRSTAVWPPRA